MCLRACMYICMCVYGMRVCANLYVIIHLYYSCTYTYSHTYTYIQHSPVRARAHTQTPSYNYKIS